MNAELFIKVDYSLLLFKISVPQELSAWIKITESEYSEQPGLCGFFQSNNK